jgi:hypothetical protein
VVCESRGTTTVVVPELGGTITVVALSDRGGLLLTQPQSTAHRISKLDMTFIFVSSFNRQVAFPAADCRRKPVMPDIGLSRTSHALIARVHVVVVLHCITHSVASRIRPYLRRFVCLLTHL